MKLEVLMDEEIPNHGVTPAQPEVSSSAFIKQSVFSSSLIMKLWVRDRKSVNSFKVETSGRIFNCNHLVAAYLNFSVF